MRTRPTGPLRSSSCASPRPRRWPPARWVGRGDKIAADQAAVDGMRTMIDIVSMQGTVVIGEGEKDEAPMLYNGEAIGNGEGPEVDVAVDPLEGTRLYGERRAERDRRHRARRQGTMLFPGAAVYMDKIVVGPAAAEVIDIDAPPARERAAHGQGERNAPGGRDGRRPRP